MIYLKIAAGFFAPVSKSDEGLLHKDLIKELHQVAALNKGRLMATEAIAVVVHQWQKENPNNKAYGETDESQAT